MVTITASYTVIPSQSTPTGQLWLSPSDQVGRWSHTPVIYIYRGKPSDDAIERMRDSLSKILVHYYPYAGRLRWGEGGRLELDCNAKGVVLLEAQSSKSLAEYGDFSPKEPIKDFTPMIDYSQPIEELPLLLVQLTRFHDDQGFAIGVASSHPLADGLAATHFFNSWAKMARGDELDPEELPFLNRTVLKSQDPPSAPRFDHPEMKPLPLLIESSNSIGEQKSEKTKMTAALLKLTAKHVEKLKMKANDQSLKEGSRPYSRFEVISAYIWRCASKARQLDKNQPTVVKFSADFRNRLIPPLPRNYFGNALAQTVTPISYVGEIISNPLSYASQKIREAIHRVTNEYIRSQLDFISGQEHINSMRPSHSELGEHRFYKNPNLNFTSWMSMPVYEADFGWGKPMYYGPAALSPFERALTIPSPDEDGSLVVCVHLQIAHMLQFIKFFWEDIEETAQA